MALSAGTRLGPYEVRAPLGAGGMGEVYRARDTKLGRDVALKILPDTFTNDPERLARFRREAQLLAALNHPHVGAIYGLDEANGQQFLVLELIDGETLADRISTGPLPTDEALAIARQIADALESAHEKGIVHRDLKPANIALTRDGNVKVLDFGLAKATEAAGASFDPANSPTLTSPAMMTGVGVLLGTAAYMSPEQAKGRPADKRTDIWAFGCVLYEMLTGRRAFEGEDITDTIAAIVRSDPDWTALPADVPDQVRVLIAHCLRKDRKARISDIAVARFLTTETISRQSSPMVTTQPPARRRTATAWLAGLVSGIALAAVAAWTMYRPAAVTPPQPLRFALVPPGLQALSFLGGDRNLDVSADGTTIVYRGATQGQPHLFLRAMADLEARPLNGTTDALSPFFSPDGRWIAFFSGLELKKIPISGGSPITLCRVPAASRGGSWGPDGTIVFAAAGTAPLMAVSEGGGEAKVLIQPDPERPGADDPRGGSGYRFPSVLPGGRGVLFTIGAPGASPEVNDLARIAVLDRRTGERKVLLRGGSQAQYVNGYLVYGSANSLRAVRFDLDRLAVVGDPVLVVDQVQMTATGSADFAVSRSGVLVYIPAAVRSLSAAPRSLVWVNRQGREEPIALPPRAYADPRLSPDGTRIAVGIRDQQNDIWIGDLVRRTLTRLTFDPAIDQAPVWTPDGRHIIWSSQRILGVPNLYMQAADGTGAVDELTAGTSPLFPTSVSPDGAHLVFWENNPKTGQDVAMLTLAPPAAGCSRRIEPLVHTAAAELDGEVSPDGRWLAYESNESGQTETYVRAFPNVDEGRWQVSSSGGTRPLWARSGREMFYLDATGLLTSVPVHPAGRRSTPALPSGS
jgi:eukaryotic-like serine/threonine-protein kinase